MRRKAGVSAINSGVVGGAMGGNPIEAAVCGGVSSYGQSTLEKYYPSVGGVIVKDFDPNKIEKAYLLNNSEAVGGNEANGAQRGGAGHNVVLLVDSNGRVMYYKLWSGK